jgi:hypothetical protein
MIRGLHLAAVGSRDGVAMDTAVAREHGSAQIELRRSGQRILVALAAAGLNVARGQDRLFAGALAVVRFDNRGGLSLAAVTDDASESVERVGDDGVLAETAAELTSERLASFRPRWQVVQRSTTPSSGSQI